MDEWSERFKRPRIETEIQLNRIKLGSRNEWENGRLGKLPILCSSSSSVCQIGAKFCLAPRAPIAADSEHLPPPPLPHCRHTHTQPQEMQSQSEVKRERAEKDGRKRTAKTIRLADAKQRREGAKRERKINQTRWKKGMNRSDRVQANSRKVQREEKNRGNEERRNAKVLLRVKSHFETVSIQLTNQCESKWKKSKRLNFLCILFKSKE